ncbi:MAG: glycosyltransferase family 87 protein [Hyphomonadaceae bacterium]
MPLKRWMLEAGAILVALLMIAFMLPHLAGARNLTLPSGQPVFGDFIAFWSAGRATLDGQVAHIHERALLLQYQHAIAPDVRFYAPWNSPPPFLLIACVLALMPYPLAAIAFLGATLALYLFAARRLLPDVRALIFPATAPAALYHLGTVQAGLLISGVTGLALHWLDSRPRLAGALVGLLAIKPHLALLWPLFLALSNRWRAFKAAALAAMVLVAAAGLTFGFDAYARFLASLSASARLISDQQITTPAYASLYANLLELGAPQVIAAVLHALSALGALAVASALFRRSGRETAGAALCAATLLISPYLFFYDFLILLMGAALLGPPRDRIELFALILAWGAGLSVAIGYVVALPLCPLAAWTVLFAALRRARSADVGSGPARRT